MSKLTSWFLKRHRREKMALLTASSASDAVKETSLFFFLAFSWCQFLLNKDLRLRSFFYAIVTAFFRLAIFSKRAFFGIFSLTVHCTNMTLFFSRSLLAPVFNQISLFFHPLFFQREFIPSFRGQRYVYGSSKIWTKRGWGDFKLKFWIRKKWPSNELRLNGNDHLWTDHKRASNIIRIS